MTYYFAKTLDTDFDDAIERATAALKEHGFGVLTEIDVQKTMKEKLDADMAPYRILGACNPPFAHRALQHEPHVGLMLPCNVTVRQTDEGQVEVSAVDPIASMGGIDNPELAGVATEVRDLLQATIENL